MFISNSLLMMLSDVEVDAGAHYNRQISRTGHETMK
jgi:hypothetical protein